MTRSRPSQDSTPQDNPPEDAGPYGLSQVDQEPLISPPQISYAPPQPVTYLPPVGLIGAGGISAYHLRAYRTMGLEVRIICDVDLARARARRDEFYPRASATDDFQSVLRDPDIEVVDVATHPHQRVEIIRAALEARKHVLSQKPFVLDLDVGHRLIEMAECQGVCLAVNQNGRWAPHFRYLIEAIRASVIGPVGSIDFLVGWDHTWTQGTPFEEIHHLLLFDFGIHWFDIARAMLGGGQAERVYASTLRSSFQQVRPPFLAAAVVDFPETQVRINFNGLVRHGQEDRTVVAGAKGTLRAYGPSLNEQRVSVWTEAGRADVPLRGCWFDAGFQGSMGELLLAIEQGRRPENAAEENLESLRLCFAAMQSADRGEPVVPKTVTCAEQTGSG